MIKIDKPIIRVKVISMSKRKTDLFFILFLNYKWDIEIFKNYYYN